MIKAKQVRLIDENANMLGIVTLNEALSRAEAVGLDLVEFSSQADTPVCKILDYGKYRYETEKKAREAKKKQKVVIIKEIKLRPHIAAGDLAVKIRKIKEFLKEGNKVKIILTFRGREIVHDEIGQSLLQNVIDQVREEAKVELPQKKEGRQVVMIIAPLL